MCVRLQDLFQLEKGRKRLSVPPSPGRHRQATNDDSKVNMLRMQLIRMFLGTKMNVFGFICLFFFTMGYYLVCNGVRTWSKVMLIMRSFLKKLRKEFI